MENIIKNTEKSENNNYILELSDINLSFGGVQALKNININIINKSITGIIGPNGAGKTTLFNIISGIYKPDTGQVTYKNINITRLKPHQITHLGIARTFQNLRLFNRSSVLENVMAAAQNSAFKYSFIENMLHIKRWNKSERDLKNLSYKFLKLVGLDKRADQNAGTLPYGLQRRLEIARALALKPELLLLDEPAAGMNTEEVIELNELITSIHKEFNLSIIIIEHHMDVIMRICPQIFCLNFGIEIARGTPDNIRSNREVLTAYLGDRAK